MTSATNGLEGIARMEERNRIVVQRYKENAGKFEKSLVFAINVQHAASLTRDFAESGVSAQYVASYRPDGANNDGLEPLGAARRGGTKSSNISLGAEVSHIWSAAILTCDSPPEREHSVEVSSIAPLDESPTLN